MAPSADGTDEREYVLGTNDEELARLGLQHHLWRAHALSLWVRSGFAPGHTLVDLGCGPGYTTADLAQTVGASGRVLAVDTSRRFVEYLRRQPPAPGAAPIDAFVADVEALTLPEASLDGAYARWARAGKCRGPWRPVAAGGFRSQCRSPRSTALRKGARAPASAQAHRRAKAAKLYESFGFVQTPAPFESDFSGCDVWYKLDLAAG